MQELEQTFSDRLKLRRAEAGINQDDLAEKVGVSKTILSRYERGIATPRPGTLLKLAEALQCSSEWLEHGVVRASTEHFEMVTLPVPRDLMTRIIRSAKNSARKPSTEMLFRLERSYDASVMELNVTELYEKVAQLRYEMKILDMEQNQAIAEEKKRATSQDGGQSEEDLPEESSPPRRRRRKKHDTSKLGNSTSE